MSTTLCQKAISEYKSQNLTKCLSLLKKAYQRELKDPQSTNQFKTNLKDRIRNNILVVEYELHISQDYQRLFSELVPACRSQYNLAVISYHQGLFEKYYDHLKLVIQKGGLDKKLRFKSTILLFDYATDRQDSTLALDLIDKLEYMRNNDEFLYLDSADAEYFICLLRHRVQLFDSGFIPDMEMRLLEDNNLDMESKKFVSDLNLAIMLFQVQQNQKDLALACEKLSDFKTQIESERGPRLHFYMELFYDYLGVLNHEHGFVTAGSIFKSKSRESKQEYINTVKMINIQT